jgi:hypothetical protein
VRVSEKCKNARAERERERVVSRSVFWRELGEKCTFTQKKKKKNKKTQRVPINKQFVVEIPNNCSLRGETTVMAMARSATKNPPYCARMFLSEGIVVKLTFTQTKFVKKSTLKNKI